MNKYKAGDKVILEILSTDGDGYYIVGSEHYSWWAAPKILDEVVEPLSTYTDQLNDKIKRQEEEITRLIAENVELKKDLEYYHTGTDTCDIESAIAEKQEEAWILALKLRYMDYEDKVECFDLEYDGKEKWIEIMEKYTYTEAAAKVAEWERAKEEIHVGDIVRIHEGNDNDLCIICSSSDGYYNAVDEYGAVYPTLYKKMISKTGRHIDVNAWLAQIGGDE